MSDIQGTQFARFLANKKLHAPVWIKKIKLKVKIKRITDQPTLILLVLLLETNTIFLDLLYPFSFNSCDVYMFSLGCWHNQMALLSN